MKIIEKEINGLTGEETITERDETSIEISNRKAFEAEQLERAAFQATSETAKREALAKLQALGLTPNDLAALGL